MNRVFRIVWNDSLAAWTVVSELSRGHAKASAAASAAGAAVIALALASVSMPAAADCAAAGAAITCATAGGTQSTTVGAGPATADNTSVDVQPGALVSTGNSSAISLGNNAAITVRGGATVQNSSTNGNSQYPGGIGANTIEFNSNSTLVIEQGANVFADGTAGNSEAVNPVGSGNTIINHGTVRSTHAAIWFQANSGNNTIVNTGRMEAGYVAGNTNPGTSTVFGANGTSAVDFTNKGSVIGSLSFASGNDALHAYTGSSITGNISGGGGANLLTLESDDGAAAATFAPLSLTGFQTLQSNGGIWTFNVALPASGITSTTVNGGTLILGADASTYTGSMNVAAQGVLQSTAQFAPLAIGNAGLVRFAQPSDATYTGLVTGAGGIEKTGAGVLTLTADQAFTGLTTVSAGTLQLGNGGTTGSVQGNIVNNATLSVNRSNALTVSGTISGSGALVQAGAGTTILTADNSYTGGTAIEAGTLQLGNGGATGSIVGNIANNATLVLNRSDALTLPGTISGTGSVVKEGAGTTTLTAANSYSGGTALKQGRLNVGHSLALGTGALAMDDGTTLGFVADGLNLANAIVLTGNNDPVIDTGAFSETLSGNISGGGFITKLGSGTLTLSGANTHTGATNVAEGTLKAGATGTFSAASAHTVASGATLDLAGFSQTVASLANSGTVSTVGTAPGTTLTVNGAYVGNNGVLRLGTFLGDSSSVSDRLVLNGAGASASGRTSVQISQLGGLGALTTGNGIEVVSALNGATTTAQTTRDAFTLAGGHVDAGAFEYRLYAADASGAGENWYLRSTTTAPATPPTSPTSPTTPPTTGTGGSPGGAGTGAVQVPAYRAEVPLLSALPSQLRQMDLAMIGNLHQRIGDDDVQAGGTASSGTERRAWGRVIATDIDIRQQGTVDPHSKGNAKGFQAGTDLFATSNWRAGVYVGQLDGRARVSGFASGIAHLAVGSNDLRSQYLGAYGTWTADSGFYADAVLQAGRHRYTVEPLSTLRSSGKGDSLMASIEVGQSFALGASGWKIEPQLQLIHQHLSLDSLAISGANVRQDSDDGWIARVGVRLKGEMSTGLGTLQPYARFNLYKASGGADVARFISPPATTGITGRTGFTVSELAGGLTLALSPTTSVYGEVGKLWASGGATDVKTSVQGSIGLRMKW
ncbi:outer membrane autotransporter protein [Variovorax paradoxus]|uniref:Outer membrane autotransporter protein n=1 Tax=Variovorax paradoxus TaxID=34073 RepID=A0AAE4BWY9_VARPD|nr:autotransporter outer membrane beta-barrel domain-containing protein [Variovorax paradoxus]MDP9964617.1 outer membrane autotransporter protein [Variovorax paradoxus]MDR6427516.1 outer membrane autotransporter protein [Variovorax paradoxus]MDR6454679.1 outer membrane autotransporter protein [Variovorax paradoxus]